MFDLNSVVFVSVSNLDCILRSCVFPTLASSLSPSFKSSKDLCLLPLLKLPFRTAFLIPHQFCIFSDTCIRLRQITDPNSEAEVLLSTFVQLQKATFNFVMSVRPSV